MPMFDRERNTQIKLISNSKLQINLKQPYGCKGQESPKQLELFIVIIARVVTSEVWADIFGLNGSNNP